jgi:hypothetical protein
MIILNYTRCVSFGENLSILFALIVFFYKLQFTIQVQSNINKKYYLFKTQIIIHIHKYHNRIYIYIYVYVYNIYLK